jgi:hypothetical protein
MKKDTRDFYVIYDIIPGQYSEFFRNSWHKVPNEFRIKIKNFTRSVLKWVLVKRGQVRVTRLGKGIAD